MNLKSFNELLHAQFNFSNLIFKYQISKFLKVSNQSKQNKINKIHKAFEVKWNSNETYQRKLCNLSFLTWLTHLNLNTMRKPITKRHRRITRFFFLFLFLTERDIILNWKPLNPKKRKILRLRNIYRKGRNHRHWVERFK